MAKPLIAMTSDELSRLGHYHMAALEYKEETKGLVADFADVLAAMEAAADADRVAHGQLMVDTIQVKRAEYEARKLVTRIAQSARGPEDTATPLYQALFPLDVAKVLLDEGQSLLTDLFILRERLIHADTAKALKAEVIAEVEGALAKLSERLATHAQADLAAARTGEQAEKYRHEFLAAYERDSVAIAKLFPDDQTTQDIYFDERHIEFEMQIAEADWWPATSKKCGGRLS